MSFFSTNKYLQKLSEFPPSLNIHIGLPIQSGVIDWVKTSAIKAYLGDRGYTKEEERKIFQVGEKAKRIFLDNIREVSCEYGDTLKKHCRPIDYNLDMQELILSFVEKHVASYVKNNPDHEEFNHKWEEFRLLFAKLRHGKDPLLLAEVKQYLNYIRKELQQINKHIPNNQFVFENHTWEVFEKILTKDVDLLDVPAAVLAGISAYGGNPTLETCAPYLRDANNQMLERFLGNIEWVLKYSEDKLSPFAELPQNGTMNFAKDLLAILDEFKKNFLPKLSSLYLNEYSSSKDKKDLISNLHQFIFHNFTNFNAAKVRKFRENDDFRFKLVNLEGDFSQNLGFSYDTLPILKKRYNKIKRRIEESDADPYATENNLRELGAAIEFHQALNDVAVVLATYVKMPLLSFYRVSLRMNLWYEALSSEDKVFVNKPKNENSSEEVVPDINKQLAFINGSHTKGKGRKKTGRNPKNRSRQKHFKVQSNQTEKRKERVEKDGEKEKEIEKVETSQPLESFEVVSFQELSQVLGKAVAKTKDPILKAYLRHAYMNLADFSAALEGFKNTKDHSAKLFYLMTMVQGSYFYLEQILHSQRLQDNGSEDLQRIGSGHNLNLISNAIDLGDLQVEPLLSELSLALFWTRSTYEQLRGREEWDQPSCLLAIKDIYEANNFSNKKISGEINKIQGLLARICDFSANLPNIQEIRSTLEGKWVQLSPQPFNNTVAVKTNECENLAARCQKIFERVSPLLQPKLKQAICHLNIVKGILHELGQKEISSDQLTLLTRGLLFWENTVVEELLQVLYGIETGIDTRSHDLVDLYDQLFSPDDKFYKKDRNSLSQLANLHNLSRYPFEIKNGSKDIHQLILQAELLRERPELGLDVPFELSQEEKNGTALNYLKTSQVGLSPSQIVLKLLATHQRILRVVKGSLLARIEALTTT